MCARTRRAFLPGLNERHRVEEYRDYLSHPMGGTRIGDSRPRRDQCGRAHRCPTDRRSPGADRDRRTSLPHRRVSPRRAHPAGVRLPRRRADPLRRGRAEGPSQAPPSPAPRATRPIVEADVSRTGAGRAANAPRAAVSFHCRAADRRSPATCPRPSPDPPGGPRTARAPRADRGRRRSATHPG